MDAPIFTPNACEGTTNLFEVDYFDEKAYLTQSGQLYGEAGAMALGRIYTFGPTFRAEKSKTRRHLTEFWMVEPEVAYMDLDGDMDLAEDFLVAVVQNVLENRRAELEILERDLSKLERVQKPFPRIRYEEAIEILNKKGKDAKFGDDFGADEETAISEEFDRPVMIHRYPAAIKAFYMKRDPDDPRVALALDVIAPEGYGEIIGGAQREDDLATARAAPRRAQAAARGVRVVPRPAPLRLGAARRLRPRRRAHGAVDLRPAPRPRDHPVSALDGKDRTVIKWRDEIPYLWLHPPARLRLRQRLQQQLQPDMAMATMLGPAPMLAVACSRPGRRRLQRCRRGCRRWT